MKSAVIIEKYISRKNVSGSLSWAKTDEAFVLDGKMFESSGMAKEKCETFNRRNKEYAPLSENEAWYQAKVVRYLDWDERTLNMMRKMIILHSSDKTGVPASNAKGEGK